MSYEDKVAFHSLDTLCALTSHDEAEHQAAVDRMRDDDVDPMHVAVHIAGMLETAIPEDRREAWREFIFDQREKARLIAAADLPAEDEDGSPFS